MSHVPRPTGLLLNSPTRGTTPYQAHSPGQTIYIYIYIYTYIHILPLIRPTLQAIHDIFPTKQRAVGLAGMPTVMAYYYYY